MVSLQSKLDRIQLNFIVGIGRSGSTLLVSLLNQHQNCIATPEIHHFIRFYKKYRHISHITQQVIDDYKAYIDLFFKYKNNPLIGPPDYTLIDSLEIGSKLSYSQLTKLVYLGLYGQKGITNDITVIVDKNPFYTLQLEKIARIFPDAKVIALIRDYRGFLLSYLESKKPGAFKKSIYYHCLSWNLFAKEMIAYNKKHQGNFKVVTYEDLISKKEEVVEDIFKFFGLSFSNSIFDFHKTMSERLLMIKPSDKNYDRMFNKISNLSKPVNEKRVWEWKEKLTERQLSISDILCSAYAADFGYDKITSYSFFKAFMVHIAAIPDYLKVLIFKWMKSPELHFYYKYKL